MLIEREDLVCRRRNYLRQIRRHRALGRTVYYAGEVRLTAGGCAGQRATPGGSTTAAAAAPNGAADGSPEEPAKMVGGRPRNRRLTAVHIGSERGFVRNGLSVFESAGRGDARAADGVPAAAFEEWLTEVLPQLEERCVIVLDDAAHRCRQLERVPSAAWPKAAIDEWLTAKGVPVDASELKVELLAKVRNVDCRPVYAVDRIVRSSGREVLRLPAHHGSLNAIEHVWADVRRCVAAGGPEDVEELFAESLAAITRDRWMQHVRHVVEQVEADMWRIDELTEIVMEPLVVTFGDEESDEGTLWSHDYC